MSSLTLGQAGSIWQQFSSFFFLTAGLFNDLLCVRTSLTMSYIFLVIVGFMGAPRFKNSFQPTGIISLDTIIWAVLNLFVHANSVYWYVNLKFGCARVAAWRMVIHIGHWCLTLRLLTPFPPHCPKIWIAAMSLCCYSNTACFATNEMSNSRTTKRPFGG